MEKINTGDKPWISRILGLTLFWMRKRDVAPEVTKVLSKGAVVLLIVFS